MARIFLSHSSVDEREAVALNKWLTDNGWDDVFLDIDPQRGLADACLCEQHDELYCQRGKCDDFHDRDAGFKVLDLLADDFVDFVCFDWFHNSFPI